MDYRTIERTRIGVKVVFVALEASAGAILISLLLGLWAALNPSVLRMPLLPTLIVLLSVALLAGGAASVAGKSLCLAGSDAVGQKPVLCVAVAFDAFVVLMVVVGYFMALPPMVRLLTYCLSLAGFALFLVYLRRLAVHMGAQSEARRTTEVLVLIASAVAVGGVGMVLQWEWPLGGLVCGAIALIGALIALVRYSRLLLAMDSAIGLYSLEDRRSPMPAKPFGPTPVSRPPAARLQQSGCAWGRVVSDPHDVGAGDA
jgi:hypothetical protein